jgi:two-component system, chemotaxis family, sensor kinase CheA
MLEPEEMTAPDLKPLSAEENRVLVVEDSATVALTLVESLERKNWQTQRAATLKEALECLETTPFDLVLLDLTLPDAERLAGLRAIRELWPAITVVIEPTPLPVVESGSDAKVSVPEPASTRVDASRNGDGDDESTTTSSDAKSDPSPATTHPTAEDSIRVNLSKLDALQGSIGELIVLGLQQSEVREQIAAVRNEVNHIGKSWRGISTQIREQKDSLPPSTWLPLEEAFSGFSSRINGLSRQLFHLSNQSAENVGQLDVLSDRLEVGLRSVRMLPAKPFFESFALVARDAARGMGKRVRLDCESGGIEVDRLVLDGLRDPLLHLIRNAVAHGIEQPDARRAAGKEEVGAIRLSGEIRGETVVVTVADDGNGIDRKRVAKRARELGLSNDENPNNEELLRMLAHPGLSTAKQVDELSGRGVGMDVVVGQVFDLRGSVSMTTTEEEGTRFTLSVPVQVTTTQGLLLQVGPHVFGVPLTSVDRMLRVDESMVSTVEGVDVITLDGDQIALASLATIVGCPEYAPNDWGVRRQVAILRNGSARLAVVLDDVPGEMPLVLRPLGRQFKDRGHLAGGAIQADGSVLPVLDPRCLMEVAAGGHGRLAPARSLRRAEPAEENTESTGPATVLVVDDSITMRSLQRSILENAGYHVIVASDGDEALRVLRLESKVDAIVTDVEMPRVTGLELCARIRETYGPDMPVIMVTSCGSEEEQRTGLEAGADAYIVKGDFRQEKFLATIERFVGSGES